MPTCINCRFSRNIGEFTDNLCEMCHSKFLNLVKEKDQQIIDLREQLKKSRLEAVSLRSQLKKIRIPIASKSKPINPWILGIVIVVAVGILWLLNKPKNPDLENRPSKELQIWP